MNLIPITNLHNTDIIKSLFEAHVDKAALDNYRIPSCDSNTTVVIGVSGGADSAVLLMFAAAYIVPHYRKVIGLFTDTKDEPESAYGTISDLEIFTGIEVVRLVPERGIHEMIEDYNGFMPSSQSRWCTKELKVKPLIEFMQSVESQGTLVNLAGIRFDEADRDGVQFQYSMENKGSAFPFISLKVTKSMVFDILDKTIGVPSTYQYRTRSGCSSCFLQRKQEYIGMLQYNPISFGKTEAIEKLSASDQSRWEIDSNIRDGLYCMTYPVARFIDVRYADKAIPSKVPAIPKAKKDGLTGDLFGGEIVSTKNLFVAVALYSDEGLTQYKGREFTSGVYFQEFITISTSLNGLHSSLGTYYRFRNTTPMPHLDIADLKIVILQIQFGGALDIAEPATDSFTWQKSTSMKQIRYLVSCCKHAMKSLLLKRELKDAVRAISIAKSIEEKLDAAEAVNMAKRNLSQYCNSDSHVVWEGIYMPTQEVNDILQMELEGVSTDSKFTEPRQGLEFDEVPRACIACSI